jgi:hypothetical protein
MRDGDYRGAKSLLEQSGRSFHKMGLRREEDSAVAQLKELEMAILREGRGRDMDGMGMGNQQEALFRQLSRELSQGIERERCAALPLLLSGNIAHHLCRSDLIERNLRAEQDQGGD